MKVSVFLGPSMPLSEAQTLLPDATFHPPAQQGDLLAAVNRHGATVIGLIDGTFHQNLSVWHNEVCYLLSRGIAIYGGSSMGALRAAETDSFGTVGVGEIYRWYRDGIVTADDEVALQHGERESGYRALSLPLVNIRASAARAVSNGQLSSQACAALLEVVREIYYPGRRLGAILAQLEGKASHTDIEAIRHTLTTGYVDQKRIDARELLLAIRRVLSGEDSLPQPVSFAFARSSVFESLYNLDQRVGTSAGEISLQEIAEYVALNSPDFEELRRASLHRSLVTIFAHLIGIQVTPEQVSRERLAFATTRGLTSPGDLHHWLQENLFSQADLDEYLSQEAICRRLRAWMASSGGLDRGAKPLVDELRMRGLFQHWAEAAAEQAAIVKTYSLMPEYKSIAEEEPEILAARHAQQTGIKIEGDAAHWAEHAGFEDVPLLIDALRRSVVAHDVRGRIQRQLAAIEETRRDASDSAIVH